MAYGIRCFYYSYRIAVRLDARLQDGRSLECLADAHSYRVARSFRCFAVRYDSSGTCRG